MQIKKQKNKCYASYKNLVNSIEKASYIVKSIKLVLIITLYCQIFAILS